MTDKLKDALMIELAYCLHTDLSVSETAGRVYAMVTRKHSYWGAGEPDCPREIKCSNGELHTLRCKVCGQDNERSPFCIPAEEPKA
jgi:hypothetical protein